MVRNKQCQMRFIIQNIFVDFYFFKISYIRRIRNYYIKFLL